MESALAETGELRKRIAFTLGALALYRVAEHIPFPGVDPRILAQILGRMEVDPSGMFAGGALGRLSITAVGIAPYLYASLAILILTNLSLKLRALLRGALSERCIRSLALVLAATEAYAIALGAEPLSGSIGEPVVGSGTLFRISTVLTLTGASFLVMWLAEQITERGIGNGFALIIFSDTVSRMPRALAQLWQLGQTGVLPVISIEALVVGAVALVAVVVLVESARVPIRVQYSERQIGATLFSGGRGELRFKINGAGIIPPVVSRVRTQ